MTKRHLRLVVALSLAYIATGACTTETELGECIGAFDDGDPALVYRTSGWNVVVAIGCVETLVVPAYVVAAATKCPHARKPAQCCKETP